MKWLLPIFVLAWSSVVQAQIGPIGIAEVGERLAGGGAIGDDRFSFVYHARTGELSAESPIEREIITLGLSSDAGIFKTCENFRLAGGTLDFWVPGELFDGSFGPAPSFSFGEVVEPGLSGDFLLGDLRYVASVLPWQPPVPEFDLTYTPVPEPSTLALAVLGLLSLGMGRARSAGPHSRR